MDPLLGGSIDSAIEICPDPNLFDYLAELV